MSSLAILVAVLAGLQVSRRAFLANSCGKCGTFVEGQTLVISIVESEVSAADSIQAKG